MNTKVIFYSCVFKLENRVANIFLSFFQYVFKESLIAFYHKTFLSFSYMTAEELIDVATARGIVLPNNTWETHTHNGPAATIVYKLRVVCDEHYYAAKCTKYCMPKDDIMGHYTCDSEGNRVCMSGWRGLDCVIREFLAVLCPFHTSRATPV